MVLVLCSTLGTLGEPMHFFKSPRRPLHYPSINDKLMLIKQQQDGVFFEEGAVEIYRSDNAHCHGVSRVERSSMIVHNIQI